MDGSSTLQCWVSSLYPAMAAKPSLVPPRPTFLRSSPKEEALGLACALAIPIHRLLNGVDVRHLFDNLDSDLAEERDVAADHPDIVKQMADILAKARTESEAYPIPG